MIKTSAVQYFDTETNERVSAKYYVNGEEISFEQYVKLIDDLHDDNSDLEVEEDINMDELLDGEEHYQDCDCISCKSARGEFTEDEEYEIGLVEHYAELIEMSECECGSDLRNILYSMLQECISMGYENAKDEIDEVDDVEENEVTNNHISIHIDNINFPNVADKNELMEAFNNLPEFAMSRVKFN